MNDQAHGRRRIRRRGAALFACLVAGFQAAHLLPVYAGGQESPPPIERVEPPEPFRRVCIRCHTTDRVVEGRRFRSQWEELIEQMIARGAMGTDADFEAVIEYLVTEFGRVNVNTASAGELAQILHVQPAEADTIVAHRKTHGRFADFDALVAVPGAPVEALTKRRDALFF